MHSGTFKYEFVNCNINLCYFIDNIKLSYTSLTNKYKLSNQL